MNPLNTPTSGQPVILGTGIGGLLTSRVLSLAGVPHVLLGPEPNPEAFRLGDSLAFEGSYAFFDLLKPFISHFHLKSGVAVHPTVGRSMQADLRGVNLHWVTRNASRATGSSPVSEYLLHVDRYGLDAALYAERLACPHVTRVTGLVADVGHAADRVTHLTLRDGRELQPSFVFDASNGGLLLARSLGIPRRPLGPPERLVAALRQRRDGDPFVAGDWLSQTQVVQMPHDGGALNPSGWVIPLGARCSVGVTVPADDPRSAETLFGLMAERMRAARRPWDAHWPDTVRQIEGRIQYGVTERVVGPNWMMIGGAAFNVYFATSAGLEATLTAARMAPEALRSPEAVAARYQRIVDGTCRAHELLSRFRGEPDLADNPEFLRLWVTMNMSRTLRLRAECGSAWNRLAAALIAPFIPPYAPFAVRSHLSQVQAPAPAQRVDEPLALSPSAK
ncbi:MAG: hypothetical protein H6741_31890 [Alphaproteobacteria bacterium]|nr:hypothetical protein [Alphaproteobacteria bacterium]